MSNFPFVVHLGGGVYLDSNGELIEGSLPPGVPVYDSGFKMPFEAAKVGKALSKFRKAMKDIDQDGTDTIKQKFLEMGWDTKLLGVLSVAGKIAGIVAPVFFAISIAIDLARLFNLLSSSEESALESLVKQQHGELDTGENTLALLYRNGQLGPARDSVTLFANAVRRYVSQLENANPSIAQLEADRAILSNNYDLKVHDVARLLNPLTYVTMFDRDEHTKAWHHVYQVLHTQPVGPTDNIEPKYAPMPPDNSPHFDHRLAVPLAIYAAETYVACIRGISPEYRTTGEFRDDLKLFAEYLDALAATMVELVLARTIYKPEHFAILLGPWDVIDNATATLPENELALRPGCSRWPVGAMDLRYHNDAFFGPFLWNLTKSELRGWAHPTKHGAMNFRWLPPARLSRGEYHSGIGARVYSITNPEECAAVANAQSVEDYLDLLAWSGYAELRRLSALFRSEHSEPDVSQSVGSGKPMLARTARPSMATTVQTDNKVIKPAITSTARREPQDCFSSVAITTQPIKRARPLEYKIKLRTLRSIGPYNQWLEPSYRDYHHPRYVKDPVAGTGFLRLAIHTTDVVLDDHELIAGASPRDLIEREGTIEIKSHTFDWWIPVKPPFDIAIPFENTDAQMVSLGWQKLSPRDQPPKAGVPTPSPGGPQFQQASQSTVMEDLVPQLSWSQEFGGHHRDASEETIKIAYRLRWHAHRLTLALENRPPYRSYVAYVVVEEKMPSTGTVLHTAVPVPVHGLMTYVPQKFFDDEQAAIERAERIARDFNRRYSESVEIGPFDPIVGLLRPGDFASVEGLQRILGAAEAHQPELLRRVMEDHRGIQTVRRAYRRSSA